MGHRLFVRPAPLFLILFVPSLVALASLLSGASFSYSTDSGEGVIVLDTLPEVLGFSALFGAVAAGSLEAVLYATGLVESPATRLYPGVPPVSRSELVSRLLSLNDPNLPWEVAEGEEEGVDLVARWKLADARWWEILSRAGLRVYYLGRMRLLDESKTVLYSEEMGELEWEAGLSGEPFRFRYSRFRGRILFSKRKAVAYAFKSLWPPDWGEVYEFDFDVNAVRGPLIETVERAGWLFQPVARI